MTSTWSPGATSIVDGVLPTKLPSSSISALVGVDDTEPPHHALDNVAYVRRVADAMTFICVHHKLCWHVQFLQRVPEFAGLRHRALAVALAYHDQCRRLHIFDKRDRRTLRVYRGVVIHGRAEKRHHPLVDIVLAVVALKIGQPCSCDRCMESVRLGHRPHRHVAAIT